MSETIPLICKVDQSSTPGVAERRDLPSSERLARAAKILGMCWGAGFVCVFVPILHFVLVPAFFVIGIVLGITTWMSTGEILSGQFTCPNCGKENLIAKETESWPMQRRCAGCSFTLTVSPANPPSV